jgi:hypothetical protein
MANFVKYLNLQVTETTVACKYCVRLQEIKIVIFQLVSFVFYVRNAHLDIIKVIYSPTNVSVTVLKKYLKFTLKQPRHVSV